jgi:hypothetical protein
MLKKSPLIRFNPKYLVLQKFNNSDKHQINIRQNNTYYDKIIHNKLPDNTNFYNTNFYNTNLKK